MDESQRIVVGVEFDSEGDVAFDEAVRIAAWARDAQVHLVHVLPDTERNTEILAQAFDTALSGLRERVRRTAWPPSAWFELRLHVRFGDVAATLHQIAVDYDATLIVIGTHTRTRVARAVLGSVAAELVRTARLPVLVARAKSFEGLARTPAPDPRVPGEDPHRVHIVSEAIRVGPRSSHISGLV